MGFSVQMIDVGNKPITQRVATAEGKIFAQAETLDLVRQGKLKKGNALSLAEAAGLYAAKRTPELLALCHPISLDRTDVNISVQESHIVVRTTCAAHGKTGVEMEALTACSVALLSLYDVLKAHDTKLRIEGLCVLEKTGGVNAADPTSLPTLSVKSAVLTLSDSASQLAAQDSSGPILVDYLAARQAAASASLVRILPDEASSLIGALNECYEQHVGLVLCTGGTGLSARDITPEALRTFMHSRAGKEIEGFGERLRFVGSQHKRTANLSRQLAIVVGQGSHRMLVVALPGSPKAVRESIPVLDELLPHALAVLLGTENTSGDAHPARQPA